MQRSLIILCLLLLQPSYILGDCYSELTTVPVTNNCDQPLTVPLSSLSNYISGTQTATIIANIEILDLCGKGTVYAQYLNLLDVSNPTENIMGVSIQNGQNVGLGYYDNSGAYTTNVAWPADISVGGYNEISLSLDFTQASSQQFYTAASSLSDLTHAGSAIPGIRAFPTSYTLDDITLTFCCNRAKTSCYNCKLNRLTLVYKGRDATGYSYTSLFFGIQPKLIGEYKLEDTPTGYSLTDSTGVMGTAYLGASTASTSDTTNSPTWAPQRAALSFTANQFVTLPTFTMASSGFGSRYSMTLSFWFYWTSGSAGYIWRRSSSDLSTDKFALKVTSSGALTGIMGAQSQTTNKNSIVSGRWTHILVYYRMSDFTGSHVGVHNKIFFAKDFGQTVMTSIPTSDMKTTGTVTFATDDAIRIGGPTGFVGKLANFKIFSPGTIKVFSPAICSPSASCTSHLGVSNPPLCLSATCDPSCAVSGGGATNACFDSGDDSCLACATGKYFFDNLCQTGCSNGFQASSDYCACPSGSFTHQQQCLSSCPVTTFGSSGACLNCPSGCDTCSSSSVCQVCSSGKFLYQGQCVTSCPTPTFPQNGVCESETSSSNTEIETSSSNTSAGMIAGAVCGSVGGLALVGLIAYHLRNKALKRRGVQELPMNSLKKDSISPASPV